MNETLRVTIKRSARMISLLFISMSCGFSTLLYAQEDTDWWFDVEILIFKHNNAQNTVTEQFATEVDKPFSSRISNIFLPFYVVDTSWLEQALPKCPNLIDRLALPATSELTTGTPPSNQLTVQIDCVYPLSLSELVERNLPQDHYQDYPTLPINYEGVIFPRSEYAHLLPQSELQLISLYKDVNWDKSYTPLLHTVWRQPVAVEQENAFSIPILAGKNLTFQDDTEQTIRQASKLANELILHQVDPQKVSTTVSIVDSTVVSPIVSSVASPIVSKIVPQIKAALDDTLALYPDQLKQTQDKAMIDTTSVFEFEGLVTVYIKYINRVPYLHIDSHALFNTAQASNSEPVTIIPHTFKQRRRVISNQVHYFDHPYFGMVIELRRYKRPALASLDSSSNSSGN